MQPPASSEPAAKLTAALRELGVRTLRELTAPSPVVTGQNLIPAVGPCARPSHDEQAALTATISKALKLRAAPVEMKFGCKSPSGIIVDVHYEDDIHTFESDVQKVVRVRGTKLVTLASGRGVTHDEAMEWAHLIKVFTLVLTDLDGDGVHDALIEAVDGEGSSRRYHPALSRWSSTTAAVRRLGKPVGDWVSLSAVQPREGRPLVVIIHDFVTFDLTYQCVAPSGALMACADSAAVTRANRAYDIAENFAAERPQYAVGPELPVISVPTREILAAQLEVLRPYGVTDSERARLLALAALAAPPAP